MTATVRQPSPSLLVSVTAYRRMRDWALLPNDGQETDQLR